ncbi:transposase [Streptomyces sp. NPDC057486]|uniref:transposase n=1 Tax=Streptomyces sp. NPDC057486 TaxID=3346145 RepID=UPI00369B4511
MSVQPQPWPQPDPQIAAAIRAMYRGKREAPHADAFGRAGKPGWSPGRLALVTVLQKAADLTDRQAADQVRENLSWKYALGLAIDDPGFDHSVLSEFRTGVVAHQLEEQVLDLAGADKSSGQVRSLIVAGRPSARATRGRAVHPDGRWRHHDLSCCCAWPTSLSPIRSRSCGCCR